MKKDTIRLMLYVDKDTNIVDRVLDALWYFGSCSSHTDIYDRDSSKDNKTAKDIMSWIYQKRLNNAQSIIEWFHAPPNPPRFRGGGEGGKR